MQRTSRLDLHINRSKACESIIKTVVTKTIPNIIFPNTKESIIPKSTKQIQQTIIIHSILLIRQK
jgi:hypothetical protein